MNKQEETQAIRHILVALDASPQSQTALAAAAELAEKLHAELTGLFVEDVNLLKLAQLPFAQEIHYPKATAQKLDPLLMEKQLHQQAELARDNLRQIAERAALAWSFRVTRGGVATELLAAALDADLLVLGRVSRRLTPTPGLGSTARTAVTQAIQSVLLLGAHFDLNQPLLLLYDGSAHAQMALTLAANLAQPSGQLRVLIWADEEDEPARNHRLDVISRLKEYELTVSFRQLFSGDDIVDILQHSEVGLFVIGDSGVPFMHQIIQTVLEKTSHPILLVR